MIKSYIGPFIFTFLIAVFVLLMQFLWKYIDEFVGKGIAWNIMVELFSYASINFIPMALPLAILLSSIMTFGNLGEYFELTAMKASGISLYRIMYPLIMFVVILSIAAFLFSNYVLPVANLKFYSLLFDVRSQRPEIIIKPGVFYNGIDNYSIRVSSKNKKNNMLYNVIIYDHSNLRGNTSTLIADSGKFALSPNKDFLLIELYHGKKYEELVENPQQWTKTFPHQYQMFDEQKAKIALSGFTFTRSDESLFKEHYRMLNIVQLSETEDSLRKEYEKFKQNYKINVCQQAFFRNSYHDTINKLKDTLNISLKEIFNRLSKSEQQQIIEMALTTARNQQAFIQTTADEDDSKRSWIVKHQIEFHQKFTLAFACLVLFFIGAPLGAIIRRGGLGMPVVVSVLFFILYYILSLSGEKFAKELVLPAWQGIWLSSAILFPIGILLTYNAMTDSNLIPIQKWINALYSFIDRLKKHRS
ncbi:MAG: YjgP/YjgQ family permease [Bacteroidales bacterium]|nr:YjgP/YjgQ family permease [Bacteroidales bacterium]